MLTTSSFAEARGFSLRPAAPFKFSISVMLAMTVAWCSGLTAATPSASTPLREDIVVGDFEGSDYGAWKVTGQAFGAGPAKGTLPGQMKVDGYLGKGLANSFVGGDDSKGTLTSPPFKIERTYLRFLIGGGAKAGETCINLIVDGQMVHTSVGPNASPGGSERLEPREWDLRGLEGKTGRIEIIDKATGSWGHINIDHVLLTDRALPATLLDARRELHLRKKYLQFPVKMGGPNRLISLLIDGKVIRQFDIELGETQPDWWAVLDIEPFNGETAVLAIDKMSEDSKVFDLITQTDEPRDAQTVYKERLRPQFHFSSKRGWLNDPNGLVYHDGEYHLFYQHNPFGWSWGNMHWGHATSRDLVHWKEHGIALYPHELGTMFSGSAVIDIHNTSGFGSPGRPAMVAMYTAAAGTNPLSQGRRFTQCIAYSTDQGRTWTHYERNPVLAHIVAENRDPKVFWYEPDKKWVMALYLDKNDFALFSSPNLKEWKKLSDVSLPGSTECPEFFEMPVVNPLQKSPETKWVFYGGNGLYLLGSFDGRTSKTESGPHTLHHGNCFYASQTYNGIPAADGRRILVAWGQIQFPGMPFNQMMDFPVELTLRQTTEGPRLHVNPVREINKLHRRAQNVHNVELNPQSNPLANIQGDLFDIDALIQVGSSSEITFHIKGIKVTYKTKENLLECLAKKASLTPVEGRIRLRMLVDRASVEIYANEGRVYMPMGHRFADVPAGTSPLALHSKDGSARLERLVLHELESAW